MNQISGKGIALLVAMAVLTGCSGDKKIGDPAASALQTGSGEAAKGPEFSPERLPVTIDDHEIIVGTTTIQDLLDDGFSLTVSEWDETQIYQYELDPKEELTAGTENSEISFWITDTAFARVSVAARTGDIRLGDAPITRFELHLSLDENDTLPQDILVDGVPVTEMSRARAGELFPDFEQGDLSVNMKGSDYKCSLLFSPKTLNLYQFSLSDTYGDRPEPEIKVPSLW